MSGAARCGLEDGKGRGPSGTSDASVVNVKRPGLAMRWRLAFQRNQRCRCGLRRGLRELRFPYR